MGGKQIRVLWAIGHDIHSDFGRSDNKIDVEFLNGNCRQPLTVGVNLQLTGSFVEDKILLHVHRKSNGFAEWSANQA